MSLEVGDVVRVKDFSSISKTLSSSMDTYYVFNGERHYIHFAEEMEKYCGQIYTVVSVRGDGVYTLSILDETWVFIEKWLIKVDDESEATYVSDFGDDAEIAVRDAQVKKVCSDNFIKTILALQPQIEKCADCNCEECELDECIPDQIRNIIRKYNQAIGTPNKYNEENYDD